MPDIPEQPRSVSDGRVTPDHRLASGRNKVERISQHSVGLFDDLKEWVELRIELVRLEVKHEIEAKKNEFVVVALVAAIALVGLLFLLVSLAFGLGAWLGHPAWGFLVTAVLLFLVAGVYWALMGPRREEGKELVVEATKPDPMADHATPSAKHEIKEP